MRLIEENGVRIQFPDNNYFQFYNCTAYNSIKGKSVKEMDAGWFDVANNTLWFVELKAFHNPVNVKYLTQDLSDGNIVEKLISELAVKTLHSLCMSTQNRSSTQNCLPLIPDNNTNIKIIHLLKVIPGQDSYLNPMQDKLRSHLEAYSAIFNISCILILSYDFALKNNLLKWII